MATNSRLMIRMIVVMGLMLVALAGPQPAAAQTIVPDGATVTEWDVPDVDIDGNIIGLSPRALGINAVVGGQTGPIWYLTTDFSRLVRFTPDKNGGPATFASWDLGSPGFFITAGFKVAPHQTAYVRTDGGIQRVDTLHNIRVIYDDANNTSVSDVGLDPNNWVYSTDPNGFVVRLEPIDSSNACLAVGLTSPCARVRRWAVGGTPGASELAGVGTHPGTGKLVYFSDTFGNRIGELNPLTNTVRYFPLGAYQPGQLVVDRGGDVYAVANSTYSLNGAIIRLEPKRNRFTVFSDFDPLFGTLTSQLTGLDAQGVVGFSHDNKNTIGMLVPSTGVPTAVTPGSQAAPQATPVYVQGVFADPGFNQGTAVPVTTPADVVVSGSDQTGVFAEVLLPNVDPLLKGVARDPGPLGTFFYAVNGSANRIGQVRIPVQLAKFATGSGSFAVAGGDASFGFTASQQNVLSPLQGNFVYQNTATGDDLESVLLTGLTILDNTATITGTCLNNGVPCTFTATVVDNLANGIADTFSITPVFGTPAAGAVDLGSIRIKQ